MIQNVYDPYRATFTLTMEDLDCPCMMTFAFRRLYYEVWRYIPNVRTRQPHLPQDYVVRRLLQQFAEEMPQEEKEKQIRAAIRKMINLRHFDVCPADGNLLLCR